jgi:glycosyltransferase involved in cell wall biosynthesis
LPAVSRNIGIHAAKGEFIAFLDDDDEWLPEKLEKQAAVLLNDPKVGLICTNALAINGDYSRVYLKDGTGQSGHVFENLLKGNFVINSSVLTRRSIIQAEKGFCEEPALKAIEDYHLWLRISLNHEVVCLNELLVIYRDAPTESLRSGQKILIYWQSMLRIYNEFQYPHLDPSIAKTLKRQRAWAFRNYLKELTIEKEYSKLALAQLKFIFGRYSV